MVEVIWQKKSEQTIFWGRAIWRYFINNETETLLLRKLFDVNCMKMKKLDQEGRQIISIVGYNIIIGYTW